VALRIPRLGVRSPLVELRLDGSGAMEVPQDPAVAGWYALGPAPGALGPAVIAGHLVWNGTPGVFHSLARLRPGDTVQVSRRDGRTAVFSVTRVAEYAKDHFPTQAVYGAVGHAALRMITCAGAYDATNHRYLDNVVAFARLVAVKGQPR
jgi:sortase (surface protein transpeptidase)